MRLFIAICLPQEVKRRLADYAQDLSALAARANVTREDNFHLTLAFLGDALTETQACAAMSRVQDAPFKLYSDKPGLFKRAGGDIHWLGLKQSVELTALHAQLSAALNAEGAGLEKQPYSPHITLARAVRGMGGALPSPPRFIVPVTGLTLMNSERVNGLLTYTPLYEQRF